MNQCNLNFITNNYKKYENEKTPYHFNVACNDHV